MSSELLWPFLLSSHEREGTMGVVTALHGQNPKPSSWIWPELVLTHCFHLSAGFWAVAGAQSLVSGGGRPLGLLLADGAHLASTRLLLQPHPWGHEHNQGQALHLWSHNDAPCTAEATPRWPDSRDGPSVPPTDHHPDPGVLTIEAQVKCYRRQTEWVRLLPLLVRFLTVANGVACSWENSPYLGRSPDFCCIAQVEGFSSFHGINSKPHRGYTVSFWSKGKTCCVPSTTDQAFQIQGSSATTPPWHVHTSVWT